jgi:hypothetical protein
VLWVFGRKHPYIHDDLGLDPRRKLIALAAFAVFALCFMPAPVQLAR